MTLNLFTRFVLPGLVGFTLLACVPKSSTSTNSAATALTSSTSYNSCASASGYSTLALCKAATFAQCYPSDKNINGTTSTCFFALDGSSSCTAASASWAYGNYGDWCIPTGFPAGVYQHSRTATCAKTLNTCDCVADAVTTEYCATSNNYYPACSFTTAPTSSCTTTPTPVATPTPSPTPSQTKTWCSNINLSYASGDSDGASILKGINSAHYGEISSYFRGHGYGIMYIRSASSAVTYFGAVTAAELNSNYTLEVTAWKSGCFLGSHTTVHLKLYRGTKFDYAPSAPYVTVAESEASSACVHTGDVGGRMMTQAMDNLNPVTCY